MLIAQIPMGFAVLALKFTVQRPVLAARHRVLVGRLMLGFQALMFRLMLLPQVVMHTGMGAFRIIVVAGKNSGRPREQARHWNSEKRRLQPI
jgi:hypothetical protein